MTWTWAWNHLQRLLENSFGDSIYLPHSQTIEFDAPPTVLLMVHRRVLVDMLAGSLGGRAAHEDDHLPWNLPELSRLSTS